MSTDQLDEDPLDDEVDENLYYETSGLREADIAILTSHILETLMHCRFLCVDFLEDAELFFPDDSEEFIKDILRHKQDLDCAEIVEGWSEMAVIRKGTFQENAPTSLEQISHDTRLKTVRSMSDIIDIQQDYPDLEDETHAIAVQHIIRNDIDDEPPSPEFLDFLKSALAAGEFEDLCSYAENFIRHKQLREQDDLYKTYFNTDVINHCKEQRWIHRRRWKFYEQTGTPLSVITHSDQLQAILESVLKDKGADAYIRSLYSYLDGLSASTPDQIVQSVVVQLYELYMDEPKFQEKIEAALYRLGWEMGGETGAWQKKAA